MKSLLSACILSVCFLITGCATGPTIPQASPDRIAEFKPEPRQDNQGKYLSPITSDGVTAEWVAAAMNAKMGASIGSAVGAYAGEKLLENVPFVGGMLGSKVGKGVGRKIAIEGAGGWDAIKGSSDLSFDNARDLSLYLYIEYGNNENFADVLGAVQGIYPELEQSFWITINSVNRQAYLQQAAY